MLENIETKHLNPQVKYDSYYIHNKPQANMSMELGIVTVVIIASICALIISITSKEDKTISEHKIEKEA